MRLPIELINYCLYLASTGTRLIYKKGRHEIYIDQNHEKHYPIYHLLHYRSINTLISVENMVETIIEFPFTPLTTETKFFVSQLHIKQTDNDLSIAWNPYILTKKSRSYSLEIPKGYSLTNGYRGFS